LGINYNKIAPFYKLLSRLLFGKSLIKSQLLFLKKIPENTQALVIGGGSGAFLPELLKNPNCRKVLYVESSSEMLRLTKKTISQVNHSAEIELRLGTEENILPGEKFNAIITYCFLDLFNDKELNSIIQKLNLHLTQDGIWLVVDFRITTHFFHKFWQSLLIRILYLFFNITTGMKTNKLAPFDNYFERNYLIRSDIQYFYKKMIFSALYRKRENTV
jgi:tRNA (cmo5U34)-methyltransferase